MGEKEKMTALIDIEKQRAGLIREKTANDKLEASVAGEAEGTRLAQSTLAFMGQLEKSLDSEESRVALLKFFAEQKTEMARASRYESNPQLTTVIEGGLAEINCLRARVARDLATLPHDYLADAEEESDADDLSFGSDDMSESSDSEDACSVVSESD